METRLAAFGVAMLALAAGSAGAARGPRDAGRGPGQEIVRARWLMGTVLEVRLPAETAGADALVERVFSEVSRVEAAASLWRDGTELGTVHARSAAGERVVVSETLGSLVEIALRASDLTSGTFSPAVGALVEAFDLRGAGRWPTEPERRRAAALARTTGVRYDATTRELRLEPGVRLDLDGIAKGFALDRVAASLRAEGVDDALLNFGGQLLSVGPPAGRPGRTALVASPSDPGVPVLSVPLRDASLSTSSNSERARIVAGREAGHLLDPRSGTLVTWPGSVTVLASTGALADALSTAWAVEGPEAFARSDPGSPLRRAGAVAFVLRDRDGANETLTDRPFVRLRPPARTDAPALPR